MTNTKEQEVIRQAVALRLHHAKYHGLKPSNMRELAEKYEVNYNVLRHMLSPNPVANLTGAHLVAMLRYLENGNDNN